MKKILFLILAFSLVTVLPSFAAREGRPGPDARAYEKASEDSMLNRMGDWFATRGMTEEEREEMLAERRAERAAARAEREAERKDRQAEREAERKARQAEREAERAERGRGRPQLPQR